MSLKLKFPYTFKDLNEDEKKLVRDLYGEIDLVWVVPTRYCMGGPMRKYGEEIYNFEPRPDDIWLVGFPRSGTTLTQEILYLLGTNLNYKAAASKIMDERFPFLDATILKPAELNQKYEELKKTNPNLQNLTPDEEALLPIHVQLARSKEKRFIKSHMGFKFLHPNLLEVGCKVVFIVRNIKDCFISNFYFPDYKNKKDSDITKEWELFKKDFSRIGSYVEMLQEAWERRNNKNLLFLFYEEVNADKKGALLKIADFLGKKLTEDEVNTFLEHIDIKNFKNNKSLNNDHLVDKGIFRKEGKFSFIRSGKTGGWRDIFSKEMNEDVDKWIKENIETIPDFKIPEFWKEAMDLK